MKEKVQKPVCLITGVGDGTGTALVKRFIKGGYQVAMVARNKERLTKLALQYNEAHAYCCDVSDLKALEDTVNLIRNERGFVSVLIHNAVSHSFGRFLETKPELLEQNFRVNTTALLYLARFLAPDMIKAQTGTIIATGNTASHRGVPTYALFAPTKASQRILCQALARELGPKRIHVAYVSVDAAIDVTWIEKADGKIPDWLSPPKDWPWPREDFFTSTVAIADEVYHMAHQHHSAWSFETTIRPFAENW